MLLAFSFFGSNGSLFNYSLQQSHSFGGPFRKKRQAVWRSGRLGTGVDRLLHEETSLHTRCISVRNKRHLPQLSFPFPAFLLEDVAFALLTTQKLTGASHFKALGDGGSGFRLTSFAGH